MNPRASTPSTQELMVTDGLLFSLPPGHFKFNVSLETHYLYVNFPSSQPPLIL
jgi:hypothetical protein